jgi:hypothetical protein
MKLTNIITLLFIIATLSCCKTNKLDNSILSNTGASSESVKNFNTFINDYDVIEVTDKSAKKEVLNGALFLKESNSKGLFLGKPERGIVVNDSLYITDSKNNCILICDLNGKLIRKVGRFGQGPKEFREPTQIKYNEHYIYVADRGNNRIQVFDHNFNYISSFFTKSGDEFDVSDQYIYIADIGSEGTTNFLVRVLDANPPFKEVKQGVPKVVEIKKEEPLALNLINLSVYKDKIYISYECLPYVLEADSMLNILKIYKFDASEFGEFKKPLPDHLKSGAGTVRTLTPHFIVYNDKILISGWKAHNYIIDMITNKMESNFVFNDEQGEKIAVDAFIKGNDNTILTIEPFRGNVHYIKL